MKFFYLYLIAFSASCTSYTPKKTIENCLNFGAEEVQLEGQLYEKSFPGPPNYEDFKKGDKKESYWFIKTTREFCVNDTKDGWLGSLNNQSEVQLILLDSVFDFYTTKKSFLKQNVIVKGTLLPQMSSQHRTQVLIIVKSIDKAYQ